MAFSSRLPKHVPGTESPRLLMGQTLYAWGELETPTVDIVLVHGLSPFKDADAHVSTWTTAWTSKECEGVKLSGLPDLLLHDFPYARILAVSWKSAAFLNKAGMVSWDGEAKTIAGSLVDASVGGEGRPVVLIGHSLGGLMMRQVLMEVVERCAGVHQAPGNAELLANVRKIIYVSTPFLGSKLGDLLYTVSRGIVQSIFFGEQSTNVAYVRAFGKDAANVNDRYGVTEEQHLKNINPSNRVAFYETEDTTHGRFHARVVTQASAIGGGTVINVPIAGSDHLNICKPSSAISQFYIEVKKHVVDAKQQADDEQRLDDQQQLAPEGEREPILVPAPAPASPPAPAPAPAPAAAPRLTFDDTCNNPRGPKWLGNVGIFNYSEVPLRIHYHLLKRRRDAPPANRREWREVEVDAGGRDRPAVRRLQKGWLEWGFCVAVWDGARFAYDHRIEGNMGLYINRP